MQEDSKRHSLELSSLQKVAACIYIQAAFAISNLFQEVFDYFVRGKTEGGAICKKETRKLSAEEANALSKEVASYIYFSTVEQIWKYQTGGLSEDDARELLDFISTLFCDTYCLDVDILNQKLEDYRSVSNYLEQFSRNILDTLRQKDVFDLMTIAAMVSGVDQHVLLPGISRMFTLSENDMTEIIKDYFMNYHSGIHYREPSPSVQECFAGSIKWERFAGVKNTRDSVLKKASALAQAMAAIARRSVGVVQEGIVSKYSGMGIQDERWWKIYYDFLVYIMYIADRHATYYLREEEKCVFRDQLFEEITEICGADFDEHRASELRRQLAYALVFFKNELDSCKLGPVDHLTENVTFQFAKYIQIIRLRQDANFMLGAELFRAVLATEAILNIQCLLDDGSHQETEPRT
ncbi:MAG: hypothetical protein R6U93_00430 [Dehalococcoidia bacterium]